VRSTLFLAALLAGTAAPAFAQSAPTASAPPDTTAPATPDDPARTGRGERPAGSAAATPQDTTGAAGPLGRWERDNAIGNALRDLKQDGIALTANYVGNFAANPVGGVTRGTAESHWVDVGAELDLGTLIGLSDTRLHLQGADFEGHNLAAEHIGSSISFQQTWRPVSGWRLTQFNIDHDFGRLNVLAGRAALNSYFGASPLNCVFMSNTACLTAYGPITAIGITAFPNSSWAAKARWSLSKKVYVQAGVFDYNNDLNVAGKGGVDFSLFRGTGVLVAAETGYETTFVNDRLPRRFRIGTTINTDAGTSPLYDRNGNPAGLSGLARARQPGTRVGIYALADQTVWRAEGEAHRNIALFGRAFYNAGAPTTIDWFASAGLVTTGTFPGRDNDTFGFLISNTHFAANEVEYLRELRANAGGAGRPNANEIIGEINYGFAAAPGVRLLPNIQYEIHPDPINATSYPRDIPAAVVVGLRVDFRLAQLFSGAD